MKEIGGGAPSYIEGNPSTAFAARLIPQYESHIRVTKETIQFVVNLTKEIPHSNRVTKGRTPKLSRTYLIRGPWEASPIRRRGYRSFFFGDIVECPIVDA